METPVGESIPRCQLRPSMRDSREKVAVGGRPTASVEYPDAVD